MKSIQSYRDEDQAREALEIARKIRIGIMGLLVDHENTDNPFLAELVNPLISATEDLSYGIQRIRGNLLLFEREHGADLYAPVQEVSHV